MDEIKRNLEISFEAVSQIRVCGDDVEQMAVARNALRRAWKGLKALQETMSKESGEQQNG